jgi:hypothetical protein
LPKLEPFSKKNSGQQSGVVTDKTSFLFSQKIGKVWIMHLLYVKLMECLFQDISKLDILMIVVGAARFVSAKC